MTRRASPLQYPTSSLGRRGIALAVLGTALLLAACAGPLGQPLGSDVYGGASPVAPEAGILRLPADAEAERLATRKIVERGVLHEDVVLRNDTALPKENLIRTRTRWRGFGTFTPAELDNPFTQAAVQATFLESFPGAPMDEQVRERRNRRGVHRYLVADLGAAGHCIYAWQLVDSVTGLRGEPHLFAVDMRWCARGMDVARMLDIFDGLEIVAPL